jgi:hypothetical protein
MDPPTFREQVAGDLREILGVGFLVLLGFSAGGRLLLAGDGVERALGTMCLLGALLLVSSYTFRFVPRWRESAYWRLNRGRRIIYRCLSYGWVVAYVGVMIAAFVLWVT